MKLSGDAKITVISGSGFSKASGIPTFRGSNGLWKNYNASQLATPTAFRENPQLVWDWYKWRINLVLKAEPNSAHRCCFITLDLFYVVFQFCGAARNKG